MRTKTIKALRIAAAWMQRFLGVRLPMGVVHGLRTHKRS